MLKAIHGKKRIKAASAYVTHHGAKEAVEIQDKLRQKSRGWNGAREIRKWREAR